MFGKTGTEPFLYNVENAKAWVANLRSGRFKQGGPWYYSPSDNSYCVLGVAYATMCEAGVLPQNWWTTRWTTRGMEYRKQLQAWLGCNYITPYFPSIDKSVVTLSDFKLMTFEQLADLIEKELIL